jgi:hypothetical protein
MTGQIGVADRRVEICYTCKSDRRLSAMTASTRVMAYDAVEKLAAKVALYFFDHVNNEVSFKHKIQENCFVIEYQIDGPAVFRVLDIEFGWLPINPGEGRFILRREDRIIELKVPTRDGPAVCYFPSLNERANPRLSVKAITACQSAIPKFLNCEGAESTKQRLRVVEATSRALNRLPVPVGFVASLSGCLGVAGCADVKAKVNAAKAKDAMAAVFVAPWLGMAGLPVQTLAGSGGFGVGSPSLHPIDTVEGFEKVGNLTGIVVGWHNGAAELQAGMAAVRVTLETLTTCPVDTGLAGQTQVGRFEVDAPQHSV